MMLKLDPTNQLVSHYRVVEKLGEGGMAVIYRAIDIHTDEEVAIKLLRPFITDSKHALKRFEREARTLSRMSHPSIVRVIDFGQFEDCPYLVMEYMRGGTLKLKVGRQLTWQNCAKFLLPVAQALAYAHQQGVVHRDIKPSNILLDQTGNPKLADFGIAKITESDETTFDLTGTGLGVGTPDYMAPEQFTGSADPRVDVYALGIVFYELLTGVKPYTATTAGGVILKKTSEPPPLPSRFVSHLPLQVEGFLLRMLDKDPAGRFQSMDEVIVVLEKLANGESSIPLQRTQPLSKWKLGMAAITVVSVITTLVFTFLNSDGNPPRIAPSIATGSGLPTDLATEEIVRPAITVVPYLFQDQFTDPSSGWDRGSSEEYLTDYQDAGYRIWINSPEKTAWSTPGMNFSGDIRLEVYATKRSGPDNNAFGVLCRHTRTENGFSFYFFYISSEGSAAIGKYIDGVLSYLANSTTILSAIQLGGETNRINADCVGNNLTLYSNGTKILTATDSALQSGDVGLIARTFKDTGVDIVFDNFTVAKP